MGVDTRLLLQVIHSTLDFNVTLGFIFPSMNERNLAYSERAVAIPQERPSMLGADAWENPDVVDSLLHRQAILIRQVLRRAGRMELNLILIDDEENIIQALNAGVEMHSLYYTGTLPSAELIRKLPHDVTIHEVARR